VHQASNASSGALAQYRLAVSLHSHSKAFHISKLFLSGVPVVKTQSYLQVSGVAASRKDTAWTKSAQLRNLSWKGPVPRDHVIVKHSLASLCTSVHLSADCPQESFMPHFVPGVHYESVPGDLPGLMQRAQQLLQDPSRLERMGAAALLAAVQHINALALVESVAWVLGRVKEVSPWEVRAPEDERGWGLVRLGLRHEFAIPLPQAMTERVRQELADQFEESQ
jgi:hypothetical protein